MPPEQDSSAHQLPRRPVGKWLQAFQRLLLQMRLSEAALLANKPLLSQVLQAHTSSTLLPSRQHLEAAGAITMASGARLTIATMWVAWVGG